MVTIAGPIVYGNVPRSTTVAGPVSFEVAIDAAHACNSTVPLTVAIAADNACLLRATAIEIPVVCSFVAPPKSIRSFVSRKSAPSDVDFTWKIDGNAASGYHLYCGESDKRLLPRLRAETLGPQVKLIAATAKSPDANTAIDPSALEGPPARPALLFYQVVGVDKDGVTEGDN